jgi:N-acetylglucosamine-6-phosphate deacetylase
VTTLLATNGWVRLEDDTIAEVGDLRAVPRGAQQLGDVLLTPGYVDLQVNGIGKTDLAGADAPGWAAVGRELLAHGITGYCPTFVSAPLESYDGALARAADAQRAALAAGDEAQILGVHLEGPFLGGAPGVHRPAVLRAADPAWLDATLLAHPGLVRLVTLAPEADPGLRATRLLRERGVTVALGHSTCSYDEALAAADAGASLVTHLFNGMAPLHHREPGLAGAALTAPSLTPTVIADLVHVHPAALRVAFASGKPIPAVSDAVACTGDVEEVDGAARRPDGTLAGATSLLDESLRNLVRAGLSASVAIPAVTEHPAGALGLEDRGSLRAGRRADVVALDATTLAVRGVWLGGQQVAGA